MSRRENLEALFENATKAREYLGDATSTCERICEALSAALTSRPQSPIHVTKDDQLFELITLHRYLARAQAHTAISYQLVKRQPSRSKKKKDR